MVNRAFDEKSDFTKAEAGAHPEVSTSNPYESAASDHPEDSIQRSTRAVLKSNFPDKMWRKIVPKSSHIRRSEREGPLTDVGATAGVSHTVGSLNMLRHKEASMKYNM